MTKVYNCLTARPIYNDTTFLEKIEIENTARLIVRKALSLKYIDEVTTVLSMCRELTITRGMDFWYITDDVTHQTFRLTGEDPRVADVAWWLHRLTLR